jgi:hypothetical protein
MSGLPYAGVDSCDSGMGDELHDSGFGSMADAECEACALRTRILRVWCIELAV